MITRRNFAIGTMALGAVSACGSTPTQSANNERILESRVDTTLQKMFERFPGTVKLNEKATGLLIMPVMTEVGLIYGGSYGQGALRIDGKTADYYSAASGSFGLQAGVQQYSHALFFMNDDALHDFRNSSGWSLGANAEYAVNASGDSLKTETLTSLSPIIAVVFAQAGFRVGATLDGIKYTRIHL